jgi:hypothetical protein
MTAAKPSAGVTPALDVTAGPWAVVERQPEEDGTVYPFRVAGDDDHHVCFMEWLFDATLLGEVHPRARANARLIAEAGTVYHETQMTPRQLADEVARLKTQLDALLGALRKCKTASLPTEIRDLVNAAIALATGGVK